MKPNYKLIQRYNNSDIAIDFGINKDIRFGGKIKLPPYKEYFAYCVVDNKDLLHVTSILSEIERWGFAVALQFYHEDGYIANQETGLAITEDKKSIEFYVINDVVATLSKDIADEVIQEFFVNFYWYMESLIKQGKVDKNELISPIPAEEGKNWHQDFVEALHKYYPNEAKEIDERIKSGDLVDV